MLIGRVGSNDFDGEISHEMQFFRHKGISGMIETKRILTVSIFLLTIIMLGLPGIRVEAQTAEALSAEDYFKRISGNPNFKTSPKGESFCWHAAAGMHTFVEMYEATHDTVWLDYGIKYYDFLVEKLDTGPDGYKGWIGPYMYDKQYWCDVHVGDAILFRGILEFAALALADDVLKVKYGSKAHSYADLAAKHCIEKWDARGTWHRDGNAGAYVSYTKFLAPGDLSEWRFGAEVKGSNLSLPFNKQNDMAQVCMLLHRISGRDFYLERAEMIFFRMKRQFQYFNNHYVWNYWEPFGQWDIDRENNKPRHWVGVHPYRNYQAGEIGQIVDAYHNGIVFDRKDIERIINTNLNVMWNGDTENPEFSNSNISHIPKKKLTSGSGYSSLAGTLWTGLLGFSSTAQELYALRFRTEVSPSPAQLYFENVISKTPAGFSRKYSDVKLSLPYTALTESQYLNMAVVMPQTIAKASETLIVSKAWAGSGTLEVDLYSQDGATKICALDSRHIEGGGDGLAGIVIFPWDGSNPDSGRRLRGDYRIRWTFKDGYREFPVSIE